MFAQKIKKRKSREKGSALFLALVLSAVLIILGTSYVAAVNVNSRVAVRVYEQVEATHIAEAGVEFAMVEINYGDRDFLSAEGWQPVNALKWKRQNTETISPAGGAAIGQFDVTVEDLNQAPKLYEIVSTGYFPNKAAATAVKTVKVMAQEQKLFSSAVMGYGGINIGSGAYVDSYDSRLGLYNVGGNVGTDADFITNSTAANSVEIGNTSVVTGDVTIGMGGNYMNVIKLTGSGTYNGNVKWLKRDMPQVSIPDKTGVYGVNKGALVVPTGTTWPINGDVEYDSIKLEKNAVLKINADCDIYVIGDVNLGVNSQIQIVPGNKSRLWINGNTNFKNGATIQNPSQDPQRFKIFCTDNVTSFDLSQHSAGFYGNIYAPNADVWIGPDTVFYGSVVGKTVSCTSGLKYHYDVASREDPDTNIPSLGYFVTSWQGYTPP